MKSQLSYATQVWSPAQVGLKAKNERVQRVATRWILHSKVGELSYRERLLKLDLLPLTFDREPKDLVLFYKCLHNIIDLNVLKFVSFIFHGRTRQSNSFNLKLPFCKTTTYQASYFNKIVKFWNFTCSSINPVFFSSPASFCQSLKQLLFSRLKDIYDVNFSCTWSLLILCPCHKWQHMYLFFSKF